MISTTLISFITHSIQTVCD